MNRPKVLLAALAFSSIGLVPLTVPAEVIIHLDLAPPTPRYEVVPAPRAGHVWQPGYWEWRGDRHVWHRGYWVRERPGYFWHPSRWEHRDGRWYLERGGWYRERHARWEDRRGPRADRDRDGIPNRYDRDRDNDGVPNRFDERPDNPRRY